MIRNGLRPTLSLRPRVLSETYPYTEVFPFRRHWPLICALAIFDIIFFIPAFNTFHEAVELWQQPDDLFNLVAALFITFWLIGWSMAPLVMTILLVLLLFGREELAGDWEQAPQQHLEQPLAPAEEPLTLASPSSLILIAANLFPLAGALLGNWQLGPVLLLYWAESAIIGFFNLAKVIVIGKWSALFAGPFFLGHFGGFMAGHFLFLYAFFLQDPAVDPAMAGNLHDVAAHFMILWPALLALFISHGYSFVHNFLGRREYIGRRVKDQMSEPYSRIIFMHLVIIFGGGLSLILGDTTLVLMGVIIVKTIVDLRAHLKQHQPREN